MHGGRRGASHDPAGTEPHITKHRRRACKSRLALRFKSTFHNVFIKKLGQPATVAPVTVVPMAVPAAMASVRDFVGSFSHPEVLSSAATGEVML